MFWPKSATTSMSYARSEGSGEVVQMCLSEPSLLTMMITTQILVYCPNDKIICAYFCRIKIAHS